MRQECNDQFGHDVRFGEDGRRQVGVEDLGLQGVQRMAFGRVVRMPGHALLIVVLAVIVMMTVTVAVTMIVTMIMMMGRGGAVIAADGVAMRLGGEMDRKPGQIRRQQSQQRPTDCPAERAQRFVCPGRHISKLEGTLLSIPGICQPPLRAEQGVGRRPYLD